MKKALCIGINYENKSFKLSKPERDATKMGDYLKTKGYDVKLILGSKATKKNIIENLKQLITNDNAFFYFSGHGTQFDTDDPTEDDHKDEAILTYDSQSFQDYNNCIIDNEFFDIVKNSKKLIIVVDSCHSGTLFDLNYIYKYNGNHLFSTNIKSKGIASPYIYCFSSSLDSQNSYESNNGSLFTTTFLHLQVNNMLEGLKIMTMELKNIQIPMLSSTSKIDMQQKIF